MYATTRTPPKKEEAGKPVPTTSTTSKVRTSIGEWESGRISPNSQAPPKETATISTRPKSASQSSKAQKPTDSAESPIILKSYGDNRVAEARAYLNKAKAHLRDSRNLRTDIKEGIIVSVDRLFELVKESEKGKKAKPGIAAQDVAKPEESLPPSHLHESSPVPITLHEDLLEALKENKILVEHNSAKIVELQKSLQNYQKAAEGATYASVTAGVAQGKPAQQPALHSVVVTSEDGNATGEQILQHISEAVKAREGDIVIDRVRKAKDRKVIIGCREVSEIRKVAERIKEKGGKLQVAEIKNKDPLIVLYGVLNSNTDEDIVDSIRRQNRHLLKDIAEEDTRIEIRYRRKARNPLTAHVVARVSPKIWQRLTHAGVIQVDIQRVRVADQSPLIQCSRCLGYGHGRKHCTDAVDVCSHCGGQHLKIQCPEWLSDTPASCVNCIKAKMPKAEHNAFSEECPIRRKWEALARSAVAYC